MLRLLRLDYASRAFVPNLANFRGFRPVPPVSQSRGNSRSYGAASENVHKFHQWAPRGPQSPISPKTGRNFRVLNLAKLGPIPRGTQRVGGFFWGAAVEGVMWERVRWTMGARGAAALTLNAIIWETMRNNQIAQEGVLTPQAAHNPKNR